MRVAPMCFSILQSPKYCLRNLAGFFNKHVHILDGSGDNRHDYRLLCTKRYGSEGGYSSKRWTRRNISTNTEEQNSVGQSRKSVPEAWTREQLVLRRKKIIEYQNVPCCDIQELIAQNKDISTLVTTIAFDIETTGFSRENDFIIEIGFQDISGGENSTFHTLVNPGRYVPNSHIHGISTNMVCRREVPSMGDLIPVLLQFVRSRQKPGGYVMFVAHNARSFDVPFLIKEFARHSYDIPTSWFFVDTLPMAREVMKSEGSSLSSGTKLEDLREYYKIPSMGTAHRAMSDVNTLSLVLQRLTFDLKLPMSGLVLRSFTAGDIKDKKKKK